MVTGATTAIKKAALIKQSATCAQRLIPRLARYFGQETNSGKQKVRAILVAGGYQGPGWDDEARAVAILTQAGKDMSKFERTGTIEKVPQFTAEGSTDFKPLVTSQAADNAEKLKSVTIILMQAEREILREIRDGKRKSLGGLAVTVGAALDEIRR